MNIKEILQNEKINIIYKNTNWTPMMSEWKKIKENYSKTYGENTIVFFQVGSFYETYFHDAYICSKLLGFTLTAKNKTLEYSPPMAGIPLIAGISKLEKLLDYNLNLVIVDEFPETKDGKQIINRKVSKIITPSTNFNLIEKNNSFLCSIFIGHNGYGITLLDSTTSDLFFIDVDYSNIEKLDILYKYNIKEVILNKTIDNTLYDIFRELGILYTNKYEIDLKGAINGIETHFNKTIEDIELFGYEKSIFSTYMALHYSKNILDSELSYIRDMKNINNDNNLEINNTSLKNLEVLKNLNGSSKYSLYGILNKCSTFFGSRELKKLITSPLYNSEEINKRLEAVDYFFNNENKEKNIIDFLSNFFDIEKLATKLGNNSILPSDLIQLKESLINISKIKKEKINNNYIKEIIKSLNDYNYLIERISYIILDNPSNNIREGGFINPLSNNKLSKLINTRDNIDVLLKKEENLLQDSNPDFKGLRIISNTQGFFIEIKKVNQNEIPDEWTFNKALNSKDRYTNSYLKDLFTKFLDSDTEIKILEYKLLQHLKIEMSQFINKILEDAKKLSLLDIFTNFSQISRLRNYNKPLLKENNSKIFIEGGRHPLIEVININEKFINNSVDFNDYKIKLITGPNMGGKSTYLKQIALSTIMAQIGCFVPAEKMTLSPIKNIYTRIGASDNLVKNLSTFAVEMQEMGYILNNYDKNSLVLFDEVGRGTDNKNGVALSLGFIDFLIKEDKGQILFSTHYSELIEVIEKSANAENLKVEIIIDKDNNVEFTHKVSKGYEKDSYGIEIAKIYNIPKSIIDFAKDIKKEK